MFNISRRAGVFKSFQHKTFYRGNNTHLCTLTKPPKQTIIYSTKTINSHYWDVIKSTTIWTTIGIPAWIGEWKFSESILLQKHSGIFSFDTFYSSLILSVVGGLFFCFNCAIYFTLQSKYDTLGHLLKKESIKSIIKKDDIFEIKHALQRKKYIHSKDIKILLHGSDIFIKYKDNNGKISSHKLLRYSMINKEEWEEIFDKNLHLSVPDKLTLLSKDIKFKPYGNKKLISYQIILGPNDEAYLVLKLVDSRIYTIPMWWFSYGIRNWQITPDYLYVTCYKTIKISDGFPSSIKHNTELWVDFSAPINPEIIVSPDEAKSQLFTKL